MHTRQDVCALTGIPVERFKTLARRDQLPTFYVPPAGVSDEILDKVRERNWNWFAPYDVFCIAIQSRLMAEIGYADGLAANTAAKIVANNGGDIGRVFHLAPKGKIEKPSHHDIWIGYLGFTDVDGSNKGGQNLGGSLANIISTIKSADAPGSKSRLFLVNASAVLREIRQQANLLSIEFLVAAELDER
jgi:hypothetical protein